MTLLLFVSWDEVKDGGGSRIIFGLTSLILCLVFPIHVKIQLIFTNTFSDTRRQHSRLEYAAAS